MADQPNIRFSRKPYTVTYMDLKGEKQTIRRYPPAKLHKALPTDVVSLTRKKNDDFQEGDQLKVKHINPKHPNVLQLENEDGLTTFVDHFDVKLEQRIANRGDDTPTDIENFKNRYLLWP